MVKEIADRRFANNNNSFRHFVGLRLQGDIVLNIHANVTAARDWETEATQMSALSYT